MNEIHKDFGVNLWNYLFRFINCENENFSISNENIESFHILSKKLDILNILITLNKNKIENILNSYSYDSYYGNFLHGLCYKLIDLFNNQYKTEIFSYISFLFYLRYNYNIDFYHRDYYDDTPYDCIENYINFNKYIQKYYVPVNYNKNDKKYLLLIKNLLDPNVCIITYLQSIIRRWLAYKLVHKKKLKKSLILILYSPCFQIENKEFKYFKGGELFKNSRIRFNIKKFD